MSPETCWMIFVLSKSMFCSARKDWRKQRFENNPEFCPFAHLAWHSWELWVANWSSFERQGTPWGIAQAIGPHKPLGFNHQSKKQASRSVWYTTLQHRSFLDWWHLMSIFHISTSMEYPWISMYIYYIYVYPCTSIYADVGRRISEHVKRSVVSLYDPCRGGRNLVVNRPVFRPMARVLIRRAIEQGAPAYNVDHSAEFWETSRRSMTGI